MMMVTSGSSSKHLVRVGNSRRRACWVARFRRKRRWMRGGWRDRRGRIGFSGYFSSSLHPHAVLSKPRYLVGNSVTAGLLAGRDALEPRHTMPDATIHTHGTILEQLNPVLYRVSLPNGKRILAHLSKALTEAGAEFPLECQVLLELTAYDFDQARILGEAEGEGVSGVC